MHFFEVSVPFNKRISFQMVEHPIEVGPVSVYFCVKNEPSYTRNALFKICFKKKKKTHGICKHVKYVLHKYTYFSECIIIWYSSKTTNHILGITPFGVGSSPLDKYCNLENLHLWILRQSNIVWTYSMHVAFFWKSTVVLAESVVEFVRHPLDMSEIFD